MKVIPVPVIEWRDFKVNLTFQRWRSAFQLSLRCLYRRALGAAVGFFTEINANVCRIRTASVGIAILHIDMKPLFRCLATRSCFVFHQLFVLCGHRQHLSPIQLAAGCFATPGKIVLQNYRRC